MHRHGQQPALAHVGPRLADRHRRGVRLRRAGQIGHRLGQRQLALGQADQLAGLHRRHGQRQRVRIGVADVFAGQDHQAPGEEPHVLAPFEHPRQPIKRRVGIAAANALDQGAGRIVMGVALRDRIRTALRCTDSAASARVNSNGRSRLDKHADLQRRQRPAGIAVAHLGQKLERIVVDLDRVSPQPALACRPRPGSNSVLMSSAESGSNWNTRLRLTSALLIAKNGFCGRRADEDHDRPPRRRAAARPAARVEAVDFVDEQQRLLAGGREPVAGFGENLAQFLHAAGHGADLPEVAARCAGQQPASVVFAGAGRTVENHRARAGRPPAAGAAVSLRRENAAGRRTHRASPAASAPPAACAA